MDRPSLLCALAAVAGCQSAEIGASASVLGAPPTTRRAQLFFTSHFEGQVEPCGCRSRPLGGVQRIAALVQGPDSAWVDAGDFLLPRSIAPREEHQHVAKAHLLARLFRSSGGVAANLGPADVQRGGAFLRELQQEGAVPLVSANVRPVSDGGPSVARSLIRRVGDLQVGFTGVTAPESLGDHPDFAALEYGPVLSAEVAALREDGAEVVVVLAHLERVHAAHLASTVNGIDLLLHGSRPDDAWGEPAPTARVGSTIVVDGGFKGRYVGRLQFTLPARGRGAEPLGLRDPEREQRLEERVASYRGELARLSARGADARTLAARKSRLDRAEARLELARAQAAKPPFVEVARVPVDRDLPTDPAAEQALAAYHADLVRANQQVGDRAACRVEGDQPSFVGSEACADCHPEAYAFWQNTAHAKAWATLVDGGKQGDLTCIGCHSIGYRQPGGFCRLADIGGLRNVGCESCHGPGSRHIIVGDAASIGRGLGERTCAGECHVVEHSDQFHYGTYLQAVTGSGHPLSSPTP